MLYGSTRSSPGIGGGTLFRYYLAPYLNLSSAPGGMTASWTAVPGWSFQLQYKTLLSDPAWTDFGSPITATNSVVALPGIDGSQPQQFYRVIVK